jgi:hypothetical protein
MSDHKSKAVSESFALDEVRSKCAAEFCSNASTRYPIRWESYYNVQFMGYSWTLPMWDERFCFLAPCNDYECRVSGDECVRVFDIADKEKHWRGGDVLRHMQPELKSSKLDPLREVRAKTLKECITKSSSGWRPLLRCWSFDSEGKKETHVRCIEMNDYIWQCPDEWMGGKVVSIADIYTKRKLSEQDKKLYSSEPGCEGPVVFMLLHKETAGRTVAYGNVVELEVAYGSKVDLDPKKQLEWKVMRWPDIIKSFTVVRERTSAPSSFAANFV